MDGFLSRARDLKDNPASKLSQRDREVFERVIQYRFGLNRALAKVFEDLDNIEKLFGFLEMDLQLSPEANQSLRRDMPYLIVRTLEASLHEHLSPEGRLVAEAANKTRYHYNYLRNRYSFFIGLVSGLWNPGKRTGQQSNDSIVTFNYDLILEREMPDLGLAPIYNCGADYAEAFPNARLGVNLLKMHGSANWLMCSTCRDRLYVRPPDQAAISQVINETCPPCGQPNLMPFIVPPTWNKGIEEKFIRPVWSKAMKELMTAGRLFIVGYSFPETDQFFKYMLGLALATNNDLTEIYVVNSSTEVAEKFQSFFNPYFHNRVVKYNPSRTHELILDKFQELTHQDFLGGNLGQLFTR